LALPTADEAWLQAFTDGMFALADAHGCVLAGGDTTRVPAVAGEPGPLTINITAIGAVARGESLTRAGARPGDDIWISGELGDAALALLADGGDVRLDAAAAQAARARLDWPTPRVGLGIALRGLATACVDVSDGLIGDLGHILRRSKVGAALGWATVPRSGTLRQQPRDVQMRCALAGGDDYELTFTAAARNRDAIESAAHNARTLVTRVGVITEGRDLSVCDEADKPVDMPFKAYDHFGSHDPKP
jgi:thiamine-monophosphate kinase